MNVFDKAWPWEFCPSNFMYHTDSPWDEHKDAQSETIFSTEAFLRTKWLLENVSELLFSRKAHYMRPSNNLMKFKPLQLYIEKQFWEFFGLFAILRNVQVLRKILLPKNVLSFELKQPQLWCISKKAILCNSVMLQKYVEQRILCISYFWYSTYFCKIQLYVFLNHSYFSTVLFL